MQKSYRPKTTKTNLKSTPGIVIMLAATVLTLNACTGAAPSRPGDTETVSASALPGESSPTENLSTRLEQVYSQLQQGGFEGVIAVSRQGGEPSYRSFGNRSHREVLDENTQVDVGSITKTITAVMVLKLVDQERISLDTTIADIWPNAPADKAGINVHQLLTHSAGFIEAVGRDFEPLGKDDFLTRTFSRQLLFAPGEQYAYSNVGYSVLAAMIEARSNKTYEDYLRSDLLGDTNITDIGYASILDDERSLLNAQGDGIAATSWGGPKPHWNLIGNGGLVMTPNAMAQFRQAFLRGQLVTPQSVALVQTPHIREGENAPSFYGYGLVVQDHPRLGRFYWHNGGNGHFTANWTDYTDNGDFVFAASSSRTIGADDALLRVAEALFDLKLGMQENQNGAGPDINDQTIENVKSLSQAFVQAIGSASAEDWQNFLQTRGAPHFLDLAPMELHISMFEKFHKALDGFEREQVAMTGPDEITLTMLHPETGETKTVILGFEDTKDGQLSGVQVH